MPPSAAWKLVVSKQVTSLLPAHSNLSLPQFLLEYFGPLFIHPLFFHYGHDILYKYLPKSYASTAPFGHSKMQMCVEATSQYVLHLLSLCLHNSQHCLWYGHGTLLQARTRDTLVSSLVALVFVYYSFSLLRSFLVSTAFRMLLCLSQTCSKSKVLARVNSVARADALSWFLLQLRPLLGSFWSLARNSLVRALVQLASSSRYHSSKGRVLVPNDLCFFGELRCRILFVSALTF